MDRRKKAAISRLTPCIQPGACSVASNPRYSPRPRWSPRQTASTAAHTAVTTSSCCDGTLPRPGDHPRLAARSARRRWRSLSLFCRRFRLTFPTIADLPETEPRRKPCTECRVVWEETLKLHGSAAAVKDCEQGGGGGTPPTVQTPPTPDSPGQRARASGRSHPLAICPFPDAPISSAPPPHALGSSVWRGGGLVSESPWPGRAPWPHHGSPGSPL